MTLLRVHQRVEFVGRPYTFRRVLAGVAVSCLVLAVLAGPAEARTETISPVTPRNVWHASWYSDELSAIVAQSKTVDAEWGGVLRRHGLPVVTPYWDVYGVPLFIGPARWLRQRGQHMSEIVSDMLANCILGTHVPVSWNWDPNYPNLKTPDRMVVLTDGTWGRQCTTLGFGSFHVLKTKTVQETIDHEVIEELVDPGLNLKINGHLAEIADPVNAARYQDHKHGDAWLTDFVFPSYCNDGRAPYDFLGRLHSGVPKGAKTC